MRRQVTGSTARQMKGTMESIHTLSPSHHTIAVSVGFWSAQFAARLLVSCVRATECNPRYRLCGTDTHSADCFSVHIHTHIQLTADGQASAAGMRREREREKEN